MQEEAAAAPAAASGAQVTAAGGERKGLDAETRAARAYRYPQYKPDKYCLSAAVPPPPVYVRQVGRMYVLRERCDKEGVPTLQCVVGPCWPMIFVTLGLILGIALAVLFGFMPSFPTWVVAVFLVVLTVNVVAFLLTACRDPGIQRVHDEPVDSNWTYSDQAQSYRAPGAIYEMEAQVVIKDIDHFCPWTGTVIARDNLRSFYVFTSSTCVLILLAIGLTAFHFVSQTL